MRGSVSGTTWNSISSKSVPCRLMTKARKQTRPSWTVAIGNTASALFQSGDSTIWRAVR